MMRYGFERGAYGIMGGGVGSFLMILFMLLLLALVILGLIALIRYLQIGHKSAPTVDDSAMMILNERFARGEINDEEFNAKKAALSKR